MKKLFVAAAALALTANVAIAQDKAAGSVASNFAIGSVAGEVVVASVVAVGVAAAIISNSSGSSADTEQPKVPTCNQGDQLSGNVCIATTQTVTVSGTGTVTVPVTSTYAPTLK